MTSATDGSDFTGTVTAYITGDGGTQAIGTVGSGVCTHEGNGYHTYTPSQAETNYDLVAVTFKGSGAITVTKEYVTLSLSQIAAISVTGGGAGLATFGDLYQDALDMELGSNDSAVLFTTARRKHAINEGYKQFCDLTECLTRRSTVSVSSSAQEFDLNSTTVIAGGDFVRVGQEGPSFRKYDTSGSVTTYLAGDRDFPQRDVAWLQSDRGYLSTTPGTPSAWYVRNDGGARYIGMDVPVDVSTSETAELTIPYVARPSSMTDDDHVIFAVGGAARRDLNDYAQAPVHYAAYKLEKLRKDNEASDRQLQTFLGYVQRFLQATRPKGPRSVRASKSYFRSAMQHGDEAGERGPWWR